VTAGAEADAMAAEADAMAYVVDVMADVADVMAAEVDATADVAAEVAPEPVDVTETGIADAIAIEIGVGTEIVSPRVMATAVAAARKTTNGQAARL